MSTPKPQNQQSTVLACSPCAVTLGRCRSQREMSICCKLYWNYFDDFS